MQESTRDILLNVALIIISIMLVISGTEVYLRVGMGVEPGDYPKVKVCDEGDDVQLVGPGAKFHERYGWTKRPNRTLVTKHDIFEDWDTHTANSAGFRDTYDRGDNSVIVLGDSFTYGGLTDDNATYPHFLDRWNKNISFHNYGINGYGTAQELLVYQDVGEKIDHDTVILGYVRNDPRNNMGITTSGDPIPTRPRFSFENGTLTQTHQPEIDESDPRRTPETALAGRPILQTLNERLSGNSAFHRYFAPSFQAILTKIGVLDTGEPEYEPQVNQRLDLTQALLEEIAKEAKSNDAQLVIVSIPPRAIANPNINAGDRLANNETYWNMQKRTLRSVASNRSHVDILDIQPEITRRIENGNQQYGRRDGHFTEEGYQTTAELIQRKYFDAEGLSHRLNEDYSRHTSKCPN